MLIKKLGLKGFRKNAVKIMAVFARNIAEDSIDNRCWFLLHQPKEPEDMAKRIRLIQ